MMPVLKGLGLAGLILIAAPVASAQVNPDPDGTLVEELVVTARLPGPAWWKVSDTDTTVYVLGVPSAFPKGLSWDQSVMKRRLAGASRVILPVNSVSVSLVNAPALAIDLLRLRSRTPYEATLSGPAKARFVAARTLARQPAERYRIRNALAVAVMLTGDYREAVQITSADPAKTIRRMAKASKVRIEQPSYDITGLMGAILRSSAVAQQACLEDALGEIEGGTAGLRRAAEAWAAGDVRGALSSERGFERCVSAAPGVLALDNRFKSDQAASIVRALATPGKAIAVMPLRPMLAQGGVLDRLRAQGYQIETPGDTED